MRRNGRTRRTAGAILALAVAWLLPLSAAAQGAGSSPPLVPPAEDYRNAQVVKILLGAVNEEQGIRLLGLHADGQHEVVNLGGGEGRRTLPPPAGGDRFLYFDVADSYLYGGLNTVELTVTYLDLGLAPLLLEYDSVDAKAAHLGLPKRVTLAVRGNTEAWKTVQVRVSDARFGGGLGGADFRIGGSSDAVVSAVGVWKLASAKPPQPIKVLLDGQELQFTDAWPFISQSRVLIPLRAIFESLGAVVNWYGETRMVEATRGGTTVRLVVGQTTAYVTGAPVQLDVPAAIVGGRTYVPLRFVGESFGVRVDWNGETQTVTLTSGTTQPTGQPPLPPWLFPEPPPDDGVQPPPEDGAQPPPDDGTQPPPDDGTQPPPGGGTQP